MRTGQPVELQPCRSRCTVCAVRMVEAIEVGCLPRHVLLECLELAIRASSWVRPLAASNTPHAAKITHITARPRVSLNLDSDGNGTGTVVVAGEARVDAVDADPLADEQYQAKYHDYAVSIGMGDEYLAAFSTRLKISVDKVWTTPSPE